MPLYLGNTELDKLYLGATEIDKVYLGATELFTSGFDGFVWGIGRGSVSGLGFERGRFAYGALDPLTVPRIDRLSLFSGIEMNVLFDRQIVTPFSMTGQQRGGTKSFTQSFEFRHSAWRGDVSVDSDLRRIAAGESYDLTFSGITFMLA